MVQHPKTPRGKPKKGQRKKGKPGNPKQQPIGVRFGGNSRTRTDIP